VSNIIQQQERQAITTLGDLFDLSDIGEGNPVAGLNTLTMTALTLANLAPGSRFIHSTGTEPVGTGFLAAGSLASSHFDDVIGTALDLQYNISANVEDMRCAIERESVKPLDYQAFNVSVMQTAPKYPAMLTLLKSDQPDTALEILFEPPPFLPELVRRQLVVVRATDSRQLVDAAAAAHSGKLLAAVPVTSARQAASLAHAVTALRSGTSTVTAAMDYNVLASCLSGASDASWVTSLPWLCDDIGQQAVPLQGGIRAHELRQRFGTAVRQAFRHRLAGLAFDVTVTCGCRKQIANYLGAVSALEPLFPGISGTVRRLPASLAFGLLTLVPKPSGTTREAVVKLCFDTALSIVKRMASIRTQIDDNSGAHRLRVLAVRIAAKREVQPCDARALTRKCHRLGIDRCRDALALLREYGCAVEQNGSWQLTRPAADVGAVVGKVLDV
jgi:hypothetical protein